MALGRTKRGFHLHEPLSGRWLVAARACWAVLALLALAVCLGGAVYLYRTYSHPCEPVTKPECGFSSLRRMTPSAREGLARFMVVAVAVAVVPSTVLGWLVFARGVRSVGLFVIALGLGTGWANDLSGVNLVYAFFGLLEQMNAAPLGLAVSYPVQLTAIMSALLTALLLPEGKLRPRWGIGVVAAWFIYTAFSLLNRYPFGSPQGSAFVGLLDRFLAVLTPAALLVLVWLKYRYHLEGAAKTLYRKLLPSTLTFTAAYLFFAAWTVYIWSDATPAMTPLRFWSHVVQVGVQSVLYAWFVIAVGMTTLRYNLFATDLVVSRTLVYGGLGGTLLLAYLAVAVGLGNLIGSGHASAFSLAATGVVVALYGPLRAFLTKRVDRSLYGTRGVPFRAFVGLSQRLQESLVPEDYLPSIVRTISQRFGLPYVGIAVDTAEIKREASTGGVHGEPRRFPITDHGRTLGWLEVGVAPGEVLTAEESGVLATVAGQLGVSLGSLALAAALQEVRQRLVVAREEERRRLQRDLHDGLGPTLAAQALVVSSARQLIASDPAAADRLLAKLEDDLARTLDGVRRLVYSLMPNDLNQLGLLEALRLKSEALASDALALEFAFPERVSLPVAVESAAYFVVTEAVTNVVRHARARRCRIELRTSGGWLELAVRDDGVGLTARQQGLGLSSMRERAEELGGRFAVTPRASGGSGTSVEAALPLALGTAADLPS